jgi:hypothetical protein
VARTDAANLKNVRVVGVLHVVHVTDLRCLAHVARDVGFAEVLDVDADPSFVRHAGHTPLAPAGLNDLLFVGGHGERRPSAVLDAADVRLIEMIGHARQFRLRQPPLLAQVPQRHADADVGTGRARSPP